MLAKKAKAGFGGGAAGVRAGVGKQNTGDMVNLLSEEWENVAIEVRNRGHIAGGLCLYCIFTFLSLDHIMI